jgi:hypothetical protein
MPFAQFVGAQTGHHKRKRHRVAGNLFGGANFLEETASYSFGKIGGTENPRGDPLALGLCARCANEKAESWALRHLPGIRNDVARSATIAMPTVLGRPRFIRRCLAPRLAPKSWYSMQLRATIAPLFVLFCALSVLGMCRDRTFNAVVAGSSPARLTIPFNNL